jgi:hypothetical protein
MWKSPVGGNLFLASPNTPIPHSAFRIPHFISPRRLLASGCDDHSNDD